MVKAILPKTDADILRTAIDPEDGTFSRPAARAVLKLNLTEKQQVEVHRLLDKNNAGTITSREHEALERYTRVGNLLSLLKAKARAALASKERG